MLILREVQREYMLVLSHAFLKVFYLLMFFIMNEYNYKYRWWKPEHPNWSIRNI